MPRSAKMFVIFLTMLQTINCVARENIYISDNQTLKEKALSISRKIRRQVLKDGKCESTGLNVVTDDTAAVILANSQFFIGFEPTVSPISSLSIVSYVVKRVENDEELYYLVIKSGFGEIQTKLCGPIYY